MNSYANVVCTKWAARGAAVGRLATLGVWKNNEPAFGSMTNAPRFVEAPATQFEFPKNHSYDSCDASLTALIPSKRIKDQSPNTKSLTHMNGIF